MGKPSDLREDLEVGVGVVPVLSDVEPFELFLRGCLLYTSDAADE